MVTFYEIPSIPKIIMLIFTLFLLILSLRNGIIYFRNVNRISKNIRGVFLIVITFLFLNLLLLIFYESVNKIHLMDRFPLIKEVPLFSVFTFLLVDSMLVIYDTILLSKFLKTHLSNMSIKESIDELPTGICYYDEDGVVLLSNESINEDTLLIMGHRLLSGINFWNSLTTPCENESFRIDIRKEQSIVIFNNGIVKNYKRYEHIIDGRTIFEIIGSDISEEYHLYKDYEKKKDHLQDVNQELKKYSKDVSKLTVEKEILNAKIKIHNDLGKLLLQTKLSIEQKMEKKEILELWNEKIQMFSANDYKNEKSDKIEDLMKASNEIGVNIYYKGYRPISNTIEENIISHALHVCLTNLVLHANGTELFVNSMIENNKLEISFTNNGIKPKEEIKEGGGLSSLRTLVEKECGQMIVQSIPKFKLTIYLNHISKE